MIQAADQILIRVLGRYQLGRHAWHRLDIEHLLGLLPNAFGLCWTACGQTLGPVICFASRAGTSLSSVRHSSMPVACIMACGCIDRACQTALFWEALVDSRSHGRIDQSQEALAWSRGLVSRLLLAIIQMKRCVLAQAVALDQSLTMAGHRPARARACPWASAWPKVRQESGLAICMQYRAEGGD